MLHYDIYLIWAKDADGKILRYYGHTENFTVRKGRHVAKYNEWIRHGKSDKVSDTHATRAVFVMEHDWQMIKVDEIEIKDKTELWKVRKLEGKYQMENECVNAHVAGRTHVEASRIYVQNNREKCNAACARYRKEHDAERKAKAAEKVECDVCGATVSRAALNRHKKRAVCKPPA